MNIELIKLCDKMSKKDKESFDILEKNILLYGLDIFIKQNSNLYNKHFKIITSRNYYDELSIKQYLESLDLVYKLRNKFLHHMTNQNIIEICEKEDSKNQIEINRLTLLLEKYLNK